MTRQFVVIKSFTDARDRKHVYKAGDFYPREGVNLVEDRAEELASEENVRKEPLIIEVLAREAAKQEKQADEYPKALGGGYYELSNGEKMQGKQKAAEAEKGIK